MKTMLSTNIGWFGQQHSGKNSGPDFYTLPAILKDAGFDAVEFSPSVGHFSTNPDYLNQVLQDAGLYFYSGHLPMVGGQLSFDKKIYEERLRYIKDWLDFFAKLNIKVAVIHPDEELFPLDEQKDRTDLAIQWAHDLADYAKQYDMKIAVETTWEKGSLFAYQENIKRFKEEIKADNLGFCFDTGHVYGSQSAQAIEDADKNFYDTWELMKDKIFTFHLHNTNKCSDLHNPFFIGGIDFKKFFGEVKKMNYDFPMTIEMNPVKALGAGDLPIEQQHTKNWADKVRNSNVEASLKATKKMFDEYYNG